MVLGVGSVGLAVLERTLVCLCFFPELVPHLARIAPRHRIEGTQDKSVLKLYIRLYTQTVGVVLGLPVKLHKLRRHDFGVSPVRVGRGCYS